MKKSKKYFNLGLLLLLSGSFYTSAQNVFVYCSEGSPRMFNPQLASDGTSFDATKDVYNRLLDFKRGTSEIIPALAESWKISKDGLSYTFQLRKGVSFHETKNFKPTRDFNADDVLFSFQRVFDKKHPYHKVSGGNYIYFSDTKLPELVKNIIKVDDYTVQFDLKEQSAVFLASLAMEFAVILSKEYGDQLLKNKKLDQIDQKPVGTGPFILTDYKKDSLIRYKTNKKYFKKPSSLDGMVFAITPEPAVRFQKLKREECHLISFPLPSDYEAIDKHKKLKLIKADVFNLAYLAMNVTKPPLDKLEVRQAIRHAMNRSLYINAIYMGHARPAKGPLPPAMWSYYRGIKDYKYSIKKAKALLKKAGFEEGFEIDLWTMPVSRPYNPAGKKMGELMQADLAQVGIKARLVSYDWGTYLEKAKNGEHQLIQIGWTSDNGDPDNFLATLLSCVSIESGSNLARWCSKPYDDLVSQAAKIFDKKKRSKLYRKAQKIFGEQAPWVPIVHTGGFRGASKKVKGYILAPFGSESFYGVSLSQ